MTRVCCSGNERPGPIHSFKFRYSDDICSFLVVAHSLSDAKLFTSRIVRLEEIFPTDLKTPPKYLIGHKTPLEEGGGFLARFDLSQISFTNPLLVDSQGDDQSPMADYIFIATVLQSQHNQYGVSYSVRDNFLIAAADVMHPLKGLVKKCSISRTPVFNEQGLADEDALAAVWLPGFVPPLIDGLESLLLMGENAIISLPLKCNAAKGYYKAPPPHLLRLMQEKGVHTEGVDTPTFGPDRVIALPMSSSNVAITGII